MLSVRIRCASANSSSFERDEDNAVSAEDIVNNLTDNNNNDFVGLFEGSRRLCIWFFRWENWVRSESVFFVENEVEIVLLLFSRDSLLLCHPKWFILCRVNDWWTSICCCRSVVFVTYWFFKVRQEELFGRSWMNVLECRKHCSTRLCSWSNGFLLLLLLVLLLLLLLLLS